jgi:hypothetical protein
MFRATEVAATHRSKSSVQILYFAPKGLLAGREENVHDADCLHSSLIPDSAGACGIAIPPIRRLNEASTNELFLKGVQLGGPVAAYVVILLIMNSVHKRLSKKHDPLASWKRQLVGEWAVSSISHPSAKEATSNCTALLADSGDLVMHGDFLLSNGLNMGHWYTEKLWRYGEKLCYLYILQEPSTKVVWCGHVELNVALRRRVFFFLSKPQKMNGTWFVYGPTQKSGSIEFMRNAKRATGISKFLGRPRKAA